MKFGFKHAFIILLAGSVFACSGGGSGPTPVTPPANVAPVANAGAQQTVNIAETVTLNASGSSDADNDALTYSWTVTSVPSGSAATLSSTSVVSPTFVADVAGSYVFALVVNDGTVNSASASVTINVNAAPVANAGPDNNVRIDSVVTLNGTASTDADGNSLTFAWTLTRPANSAAVLSDSTAAMPTFNADIVGVYTATLVVNDGSINSAGDSVIITAAVNSVPIASAGPNQNVRTNTVITLDGTQSSDANGDQLTYLWTLTSPATSTASLVDATTAAPKFTADIDGRYIATLVVSDGILSSAASTVQINASTTNSTPTANAGVDQNVLIDNLVTLDGSSSQDANGDLLTYQWSLTTAPAGSTAVIANATTVNASFTPELVGTYVAQLVVSDGTQASTADTVTIEVTDGNSAPVANAGTDFYVKTGSVALLDGSASSDANGDGLLYTWGFVSRPTGSAATLDNNSVVNPSFTGDLQGSYVLSLVVSDTMASSVADNVLVKVADGEIRLREKEGVFGNTFNEVPFPYDETITLNTEVVGSPQPTTVTVDAYRITALGGDLTIINLTAVNETNAIVPFFSGAIAEGFVLEDGEELEFGLVSPLTGGDRIQLRFSFEIEETGQIFSSDYLLTSN